MQSLIENWGGYAVVSRYDKPTGAWIFIALYSDAPEGASGGTRIKVYDTPAAALTDAMRLAEGMTYKWASIQLDVGGAKAVIAIRPETTAEERRGLLGRYGELVESLRGAFFTGQDLGTTVEDVLTIAESTRYVHGVAEDGSAIDPSPYTAWGVYSGLRQALKQAFGSADPAGRSVLIQGVGSVGTSLAGYLRDAGARILVSDIDPQRAALAAERVGGGVVPVSEVYTAECDVFAPCAIGGILSRETISGLNCRVVAGSANNQLLVTEDAERLHARGILYSPDYLINAGGALSFGLRAQGVTDSDELMSRMNDIGDSLAEIFVEAAENDESPLTAAARRTQRFLGG